MSSDCEYEIRAEGIVLAVAAQPGAKKNEVAGIIAGALRVRVTQAPEKGKANKVIVEQLARFLDVRKSQIELLTGETSRKKRFLVRDLDEAALRQCLAKLEKSPND